MMYCGTCNRVVFAKATLGKEFPRIPDHLEKTPMFPALKFMVQLLRLLNLVFHRILDFKKGSISIDPFGVRNNG